MKWPEYLYGDLLAWGVGVLIGFVILLVAAVTLH